MSATKLRRARENASTFYNMTTAAVTDARAPKLPKATALFIHWLSHAGDAGAPGGGLGGREVGNQLRT